MPAMTKRVNVVTRVAVRNVNPPISGSYKNIIMSTSDILKLLSKRAMVEEILPDGSTVKLTMRNYYTDNGAGLDAYAGVNMDDKYNTDKDSKKNRGPLVHKAKPATPPTPPVKPIIEPAPIEVVDEEKVEAVIEEVKEAEGTDEVMEGIEAPITLEEHEDAEEVEASLELASESEEDTESDEENDEEDYEEEVVEGEEHQTTATSNNNSNNNHHKKKKKKR